ncbi:hypothetical protein CGCF413_v011699 [Colletotrichum fructicola]|nr:hypothetical protein CGCF413_v011699 [Colletotrichum fructicola]
MDIQTRLGLISIQLGADPDAGLGGDFQQNALLVVRILRDMCSWPRVSNWELSQGNYQSISDLRGFVDDSKNLAALRKGIVAYLRQPSFVLRGLSSKCEELLDQFQTDDSDDLIESPEPEDLSTVHRKSLPLLRTYAACDSCQSSLTSQEGASWHPSRLVLTGPKRNGDDTVRFDVITSSIVDYSWQDVYIDMPILSGNPIDLCQDNTATDGRCCEQKLHAMEALFDAHWDDNGPPYDKAPQDPNAYSTGSIGRHNVVLAHMPGMGKANATRVATFCRISLPNITLALIVGICGAVPFTPDSGDEVVLGDVIISDGIVQYDFGKRLPDRFIPKDTLLDSLGRPNTEIRSLLAKLKSIYSKEALRKKTIAYVNELRKTPELKADYPGVDNDFLFQPTFHHLGGGKTCEESGCKGELIRRLRLDTASSELNVHFGLIASGDTVMKAGDQRDEIAQQQGVIGFEMEGAGTKLWQSYAAVTAAACTKAFLSYWVPHQEQPHQGKPYEEQPRISSHNSFIISTCRSHLYPMQLLPHSNNFHLAKEIFFRTQSQHDQSSANERIVKFNATCGFRVYSMVYWYAMQK